MARLILQNTSSTNHNDFVLSKAMVTIGSATDNDIVIGDDTVDPYHAVVHCDGTYFQIQILERGQELYINQKKRKKQILAHGDCITIGASDFVFSLLETDELRNPTRPSGGLSDQYLNVLQGYRRFYEISELLLTKYNLSDLLESLMDAVIEISNADKGFLILSEGEEFAIKVARNINSQNIEDAVNQVSDSVIAKAIESKTPLIVSDAINDEEFNASQSVINLNLCSVMCVPLVDKGNLLGVIYVGNDNITNLFTEDHLELLTVFAAQASLIVANAIMVNELKVDNQQLHRQLADTRFGSLIGACSAMKDVFRMVERVASTTVNVLVIGDTGTGKELIANEIHRRSPRKDGPFITINCGAIPENLLESELFGHQKGAFTGAASTREGLFQAADKGTIFLDEIGEMPLNLQVKLLRVLQEHVVTKVGSTTPEKIDIRVVAATNKNIEEAVKKGEFREDLFYRLNVVMLTLPALRDRGEDVVLIAQYLLGRLSDELGFPKKKFSAEAIVAMKKYDWPGNIRQLENRIKKALVLSSSAVITAQDMDLLPEFLMPIMPLSDAKEAFAQRYILETLERNSGNRTQTARDLNIDPRTVFRYLERQNNSDISDGNT